jgi:hypothetical protein
MAFLVLPKAELLHRTKPIVGMGFGKVKAFLCDAPKGGDYRRASNPNAKQISGL